MDISGQHDFSKICYKCKKSGHLSRDCQETVWETDQSQGIVNKHANGDVFEDPGAESDKTTSETDKIAIEEDGIHEMGEEGRVKLNDLDYLTGNPLPDDILLYAVPVCGPYNALQTYKYRVKITPGTAKKGKGIFLIICEVLGSHESKSCHCLTSPIKFIISRRILL